MSQDRLIFYTGVTDICDNFLYVAKYHTITNVYLVNRSKNSFAAFKTHPNLIHHHTEMHALLPGHIIILLI